MEKSLNNSKLVGKDRSDRILKEKRDNIERNILV
jgi:hypothetical protein